MSAPRPSLRVGPELSIPAEELQLSFARSGGPGGQNVNKVESKVVLRFDVQGARCLSDRQRELLLKRLGPLGGRLTREGVLVLHSSRHRERKRNEEAARERLAELLLAALTPPRPRRKTRTPRSAREGRLTAKHVRSEVKRRRRRPEGE